MMGRLHAASLAVCVACGSLGRDAGQGSDSAVATTSAGAGAAVGSPPLRIEALAINRGTQGMRSTVRWVVSPDRSAILAVEDPVSVEAEALPDGFLYASERTGVILQLDSVWDVAPSPDWTRLAVGRAFVLRAGERDTIPRNEWQRLEGQLPEDVAERDPSALRRRLEAHAFPASGMSLMLGLGLAQVMWIDSLTAGRVAAPIGPTHSLHGWRVRWMMSGDTLGVGVAPRAVQDDAPAARWVLVRARRGASYRDTLGVTTDSTRFARVAWTHGPVMELGSPIDLSSGQALSIDGGTVDAQAGSIRLTRRSAAGSTDVRVIGPGVPLAATANGRFILALVPRANAREHEMRAHPVMYHISAR
jgi:hypothetical protein